MIKLDGMMRNTGYGGEGIGTERITIREDLRPKEEILPGYKVCCPGVPSLDEGTVLRIDADQRLAKVNWTGGLQGWWYLKDLKVVKIPVDWATHAKAKIVELNLQD